MLKGVELGSSLPSRPWPLGRAALDGGAVLEAAARPAGSDGAFASPPAPGPAPAGMGGGAGAAAGPGAEGGALFPPPAAAAGDARPETAWREAMRREWGPAPAPGGPGAGAEASGPGPVARLVTVFSPKGGVGKTFVASNLAALLAGRRPGSVALADMALPVGDTGVYLDLAGGPTLVDALPFAAELGPDGVRKFMMSHRPSGLEVLLGPARPELSELVRPEAVGHVLAALEAAYDLTLVDTSPDPASEVVGECFDRSGCLVLVAGPDAGCLRQVRLLLELMGRLRGASHKKLILVLNRWPGPTRLGLPHLGEFLGRPVDLAIPEDRAVVEGAALSGRPLVHVYPRHPITQALDALAQMVWPRPRPLAGLVAERGPAAGAGGAGRGGFLGRWWGRWRG